MKRRILVGLSLGIFLVSMVLFPMYVGVGEDGFSLHIGNAVLGADLDYECDGVDDNVQFQSALDDLSVSGGMLFVHGGDYAFASNTSVSRSIDNVSIVGVGGATYISGDGSTPLFIAGGDNWLFMNIKFDAGNVTVSGTNNWLWFNVFVGSEHYVLIGDDVVLGSGDGLEVHGNEYHSPDFATVTALSILEGRVGVNEADILELSSNYSALSAMVVSMSGDIDALQNDVGILDGRLDTAESDIVSLESLTSSHSNLISILQGNVTSLDGRLDTAESDIDDLESGLVVAESDIDDLEGFEVGMITTDSIVLYVDGASGSDSNDGSQSYPKLTISGALDSLPVIISHSVTIKVRNTAVYSESDATISFGRFNTLVPINIKSVNGNDEDLYDKGKAESGGSTTLTDSDKSWSTNQFDGAYVVIYEGTGAGQIREIASNTGTVLTVTSAWSTNPSSSSYYFIGGGVEIDSNAGNVFVVAGKQVNFYGFEFSENTGYAVYFNVYSNGNLDYCVAKDGTGGLCIVSNYSTAVLYYNYCGVSTAWHVVYGAVSSGLCRAGVSYGATSGGLYVYRDSYVAMGSAGVQMMFYSCYIGIRGDDGAGVTGVSSCNFVSCTTDYSFDANSWYD